ncbi:MAG: DUF1289 domain-containing protein [Burkholderiaceae bacterium]|jgi:predicted Fe-S protein YdhL (DUF1289 family)
MLSAPWPARLRRMWGGPPAPVPSPCVSVCVMEPERDSCRGCGRTLGEIANWSAMDDEQRLQVWLRLAPVPKGDTL